MVFDPYEDNYVPGFAPLDLDADLVLCSHQHNDHNAAHVVRPRSGGKNPFRITTIDTFHDPEGGALRGTNTIHILEAGGLRLAHFGDIGCPLTPQQREALSGLDVALIPVGGFYTIGPEEAKALIREISPKITAWETWDSLPSRSWMTSSPWWATTSITIYHPDNSLTINAGTEAQIAVLTYQG